ncbi:hypothetical protein Tco_0279929, partial [Tanacetum coccineum]
MQKKMAIIAKYFKKLYKPTNNNLRTSSNSRNKTEDTTPRYNNDKRCLLKMSLQASFLKDKRRQIMTESSQQGLEFLFSPLLEEYYNPTHGLAEENNNDQASNASFHQDDFFNPFCTR